MKTAALLVLLSLLPVMAMAQPAETGPPKGMVVTRMPNGRLKADEVYLLAVTATQVAYKVNVANANVVVVRMSEVDSLFLYDPMDYLNAMDLFEERKYAQAKNAFRSTKQKYGKCFPGIPNNPGVMSAFYELECLRKENDLQGLRTALLDFNKDALTHRVALQQLELYEIWDAIRGGRNKEVLALAERYEGKRLPVHQRAQVAYCVGRAKEALNRPQSEILLAYQTAITADGSASEMIAQDAALRAVAILHNDEDVKAAIKRFAQGQGVESGPGSMKLLEAAGLSRMLMNESTHGELLPIQYRHFLKFSP